ncbi:uncharacterized protein LOC113437293 [Pseudonaja textilis]|uniref:uncharacterized protein LOC113437293 n=1 Tax=Pseudonaja textilis TaxID=8673 RepID=UPI000EAA48DE|nr:uncharacterized protein LOC113437293 [Pseudonaja textilis]
MVIIGHSNTVDARKMHVEVSIEGQPCGMEVNSGSYLSMVSWCTIKHLVPTIHRCELESQKLTLKDYQGNRIPVARIGHFKVAFKGHTEVLPLIIVDKDHPSLLGLEWFAPLGIEVTGINHITEADWEETLVRDFQEVFNGDLGKYRGSPISFSLNPNIAPICLKASDIAKETNKDKRLAQVLNWLFTQKGCILWGDRMVIPETLQKRVLTMLHEGHPGIVKMKALARSYAWWPGMDKQIETWVASCRKCQEARPNPPSALLLEWETPRGPWSRVHIDFVRPTKGHTFLITVDAYSNWLEVSVMKSTTMEAVIKELTKLFTTHGLPEVLVSDNGPQFTALAFEKFLAERGIRHALTAPAHPAANGWAERMVHYTKNTIEKIETGDIHDKLNKMLLIQHITPNTRTNKSPAELLMGRKLRSQLDRLHPTYNPEKSPDSSSKFRIFAPGDAVYAKNFTGDPLWVLAKITQLAAIQQVVISVKAFAVKQLAQSQNNCFFKGPITLNSFWRSAK